MYALPCPITQDIIGWQTKKQAMATPLRSSLQQPLSFNFHSVPGILPNVCKLESGRDIRGVGKTDNSNEQDHLGALAH